MSTFERVLFAWGTTSTLPLLPPAFLLPRRTPIRTLVLAVAAVLFGLAAFYVVPTLVYLLFGDGQ